LNYLSHYYIDSKPGNHYYNSALFIPDFARNYARGFHQYHSDLKTNETQLQLGCMVHINADKMFHPSSFFKKYSQIINVELKNFEPLVHLNRKWFLSHIMFEMLIDRLLVKHFPSTCHSFYSDLEAIDTKTLEEFVLRYSYKNIDQFMRNFKHFCEVKYLFAYTFNDSFVFSIARVYKQATTIDLSMSDRFYLKEFVNKVEQQYFYDPIIIIAELKQVFNIKLEV
jgi:hypothetical protein